MVCSPRSPETQEPDISQTWPHFYRAMGRPTGSVLSPEPSRDTLPPEHSFAELESLVYIHVMGL